ncbi:MAG: DUF4012 domain-containing protein [Chloroflexi bacterium]|nr:DUF4012 domain-containing protein [Chloroflexota bacterium]
MTAQLPPAAFRWRRILTLAIALLLALALIEGHRAWRVVEHVNDGRAHLRAGQDRMEGARLDASDADLEAARRDFRAARGEFRAADGALSRDPLVSVARHIPGLGRQVDGAAALAVIGVQGADIGEQGVEAIAAFNAVRADASATLPEWTPQLIERIDPHIAAAETTLAAIDERRAEADAGSLLPLLSDAYDEVDVRRERLREMLESYRLARDFAPEFLGFDGPRTYLVLAQNNAELLPTGGLISVAGTLRLNRGRVEEMEFRDAVQMGDDWMAATGAYVAPPNALRQYLLKDTSWNLTSSNWSPDFPTSAQTAARFFEMEGGTPVDGVIAVDVTTLERLLEVTGPVEIPEFDVTVSAENAFDLTEEHTRAPYEPAADRKAFAALLADEVIGRVLHPEPGQWSPLVDTVQRLGDEKDLLLYSFDPGQQALIEQMGWDGAVANASPGDYLMVVDASVNSTKLNAVVEHSADILVQLAEDGTALTTVHLDYENPLSAWGAGRDPQLVEKLMLGGQYGGYVRVLAPDGSRVISVHDGQEEIGLEEVGTEQGRAIFGRFFAVQADERERLSFTYVTPRVVETDGDTWTYTLHLQRQPGWEFSSVSLNVEPPSGMKRTGTTIDGAPTSTIGQALPLDLSRDRVVTVSFSAEG